MIYIAIFFVLGILASLDLIEGTALIKKLFFGIVIVFLILLSSIRWETGPDWDSYFFFYRDIDLYTKGFLMTSNFMEPGYTKLNVWVNALGFSYTGLLAVIAIITVGFKARVIYFHKEILMITLFLYYCYYLADIASVRQFTALSITLFSSIYIVKRKPIIFCALVLLACTIHITSILFLLAYWIYHRKHSATVLYSVLLVSLFLGVVNISDRAINTLVSLVGEEANIAVKLLRYQEEGLDSTINPYFNFLVGVVKRIVVLPLFIWAVKIIDERYKARYIGYLNLLVFGNIIYFLFALSIPVIQRLSVPFLIFEIFIWGYLLISIKEVNLRFFTYLLILLFGALRLYLFLAPYMELYLPFKTIFNA